MSPAPLVEYIDYKSLFEQERSEKLVSITLTFF